ncbi:MAG: NAD(P)/FAD-dependent oxidoreductase [Aeromicrobium erythreum]
MTPRDVVVVGGSTAGTTTVRELRRLGFDGRVVLVDPVDGTHRPPLSKGVLSGDDPTTARIAHDDLDAEVLRATATGLDPGRRRLRTDAGTLGYDALVVATGSHARRLVADARAGEHVLRTLEDALRLRERLASSEHVVVVGAGFLGLEAASAAVRAGARVTVVDPEPPLLRLLGAHLADVLVERCVESGIALVRSGARLLGDPVDAVLLDDATRLPADLVVTCVGDVPATQWLATAGGDAPGGLPIDAAARTAWDGVLAAGDAAAPPGPGGHRRTPYWASAAAQGRVAAATILGVPPEHDVVDPYHWTEVAGTSLKVVGPLPVDGPPDHVVEGDGPARQVVAWSGPTVAAVGLRRPLPRLRRLAADLASL